MNKLFTSMQVNDTFTENDMPIHSTSGSDVLDLFFKMGGSRGMDEDDIERLFRNAFNENHILTTKAMFYNRDVRGGQGERRSFRIMFDWLCVYKPEVAKAILHLVPVYGRWDDLLVGLDSGNLEIRQDIANFILDELLNNNVLTKKWMPRENKSKKEIALDLMKLMRLSPRKYRKLISTNKEVVENFMCSKEWEKIDYNHVPSVASKKYRKAFGRNDRERYGKWLEALEKGDKDVKINAGAIFPHDIVKGYLNVYVNEKDRTLEAQWKALPDFVKEGLNFLPVVDVSGSMRGLPLEVAVSLGVYLAERNKSVFKNGFVTFSNRPALEILKGESLYEKVTELRTAHWEMDTNFEAVFKLILNKAKAARLSQEDMPSHVVILSDMQFNECVENADDNSVQMVKRMYDQAGYEMPKLVFWNLCSSEGIPVKFDENGTCLVSGFSPSVMQSLLGGDLNPMSMMLGVLNSERYKPVEEALK